MTYKSRLKKKSDSLSSDTADGRSGMDVKSKR